MPEAKKVRLLIRGEKKQLFVVLVRYLPTTMSGFFREPSIMERMLQQRLSQYERQTVLSAVCSLVPERYYRETLTELIRQVVRKELQNCHTAAPPIITAVADLIRD